VVERLESMAASGAGITSPHAQPQSSALARTLPRAFDDTEQPGDQIFEDKGLKLYVNLKSFLYLAGTQLDFSDGLDGKGFHFNNPNAARSCGCGESFSV